jgi:catechol 2,3-dioxygenase-like lactoylglutathione lyase family enzyme
MTITGFDHYTIRCADLQRSWRFYAETLGLRVIDRPGFPNPKSAAIVYLDQMMLIHLFQATPELEAIFARQLPADAETAQWATGRVHHIAYQARDLPAFRARLEAHRVPSSERTLTAAGKHLIVVRDPDGVEIELSFSLDEIG